MTEYHVGCGVFGIYAGTLNTKGDLWRTKTDVTDEAISAVAQYLLEHNKDFIFEYKNKKYKLAVLLI